MSEIDAIREEVARYRRCLEADDFCRFESGPLCDIHGRDIRIVEIAEALLAEVDAANRSDLERGIFLLDIEHDPAALQALETYAYAVNVQGDRPLCDELMEKIKEVRARRSR